MDSASSAMLTAAVCAQTFWFPGSPGFPDNALQKMLQVHEQFTSDLHTLGFHSVFSALAQLYRFEHWCLVWLGVSWHQALSTLHPEGVSSWSSSCLLFIGTAQDPTVNCQKATFMTDHIPFPLISPLSTWHSWISNYGWTLMCLLCPFYFFSPNLRSHCQPALLLTNHILPSSMGTSAAPLSPV